MNSGAPEGLVVLAPIVAPVVCYSWYVHSDKSWMRKGSDCDYDKRNIYPCFFLWCRYSVTVYQVMGYGCDQKEINKIKNKKQKCKEKAKTNMKINDTIR